MGIRGLPPMMSHELMFQTSTQYVEAIQSYWCTNAGYRNGVLMVVRENDLKHSKMFWINYLLTLEFPIAYHLLYNPYYRPYEPHLHHLALERVRVLIVIFERGEDLVRVFKTFHSIEVCWVRKTFLSMETQNSHLFLKQKAFFLSLQNFFFHWIPWDTLFHHGLQKHNFNRISWKTS